MSQNTTIMEAEQFSGIDQKEIQDHNLKDCFYAILTKTAIQLDEKNATQIIRAELEIEFTEEIFHSMQSFLIECLLEYMAIWPEWSGLREIFTEPNFAKHFDSFRRYLSFKLNFVVENKDKIQRAPVPDKVRTNAE